MSNQNAVLSDVVYEYIKDLILEGRIKPGEKIIEQKIMEQLKVSRTPVREAILKLSTQGVVTLYPKCYAEVITFDAKRIKELGEIRLYIDTLATQLAVYYGSNKDFDNLMEIGEKCTIAKNENNLLEEIRLGSQFHLMIAEISGNKLLLDIQKRLHLQVQIAQLSMHKDIGDYRLNSEQHTTIVKMLFERNVEKAVEAAQQHIIEYYNIAPTKHLSIPQIK